MKSRFEKVALPYATDALEPVMSKRTIEFHYGKHHQAYVDNLNRLTVGTKFENADLITVVKESDGAIFNNAGQVYNHDLFFTSFKKGGGGEPTGALAKAINEQFGSFEQFKEQFNAAGVALFGSGWVWLAKDADGKLSIEKEGGAGNPITRGLIPILGFDVWEHAYYLDYQNRRGDHLKELWSIIDREPSSGKCHIDLTEINRRELIRLGVPEGQVGISGLCTFEREDLFFSARRQTIHSGRMLTGIKLEVRG